MMYTCAMKEIRTKFDVLNTGSSLCGTSATPIKFISTRLKSTTSIGDKLDRLDIHAFSLESIEAHIHDVAGIRVICSLCGRYLCAGQDPDPAGRH